MSERKYSSTRSGAARKTAAAMLPCPCFRCGRMVTADMKWNADHPIARVDAEAAGIPQHEQDAMVVPSHRSCDAKAGAKLGNTHRAKKPKPRTVPKVDRPQLAFSATASRVPGVPLQNPRPIPESPTGDPECLL